MICISVCNNLIIVDANAARICVGSMLAPLGMFAYFAAYPTALCQLYGLCCVTCGCVYLELVLFLTLAW